MKRFAARTALVAVLVNLLTPTIALAQTTATPTLTASPITAPVKTPITFTLKIPNAGSQPVAFTFVFGDGKTQQVFTSPVYGGASYTSTTTVTHAYETAGTFAVSAALNAITESTVYKTSVRITPPKTLIVPPDTSPTTKPKSSPSPSGTASASPATTPSSPATAKPVVPATYAPTATPTAKPSISPTKAPTPSPTPTPTASAKSVVVASSAPTATPTPKPTRTPTATPKPLATAIPTAKPTAAAIATTIPKRVGLPTDVSVVWPDGSRSLSVRPGGAVAQPIAEIVVNEPGRVVVQWIVDDRLYATSTQFVQTPGRVKLRLDTPLPASGTHTVRVTLVPDQALYSAPTALQRINYVVDLAPTVSSTPYALAPPKPNYSASPLVLVPTPAPPNPNPIFIKSPVAASIPVTNTGTSVFYKGQNKTVKNGLLPGTVGPTIDDTTVFQWQPSNPHQYTSYSVTFTRPNGSLIETIDAGSQQAIQLTPQQFAKLVAIPHLAGGNDASWYVTGIDAQQTIKATSDVGTLTLPGAANVVATACAAGQQLNVGGTSLTAQANQGGVALKGSIDESRSPFAFPTHVVASDGTQEIDNTMIDWGDGTSSGVYADKTAGKSQAFPIRDFDGFAPSHAYYQAGDHEISVYAITTETQAPTALTSFERASITSITKQLTYPYSFAPKATAKYIVACIPVKSKGDSPLIIHSVSLEPIKPNLYPPQCFAIETTVAHVEFEGIGDAELHWQWGVHGVDGSFTEFSVTRAYFNGADTPIDPRTSYSRQDVFSPPFPPSAHGELRVVVVPIRFDDTLANSDKPPGTVGNPIDISKLTPSVNVILRTPGDLHTGGPIGGDGSGGGGVITPTAMTHRYDVAAAGVHGLGPARVMLLGARKRVKYEGKSATSPPIAYIYGGGLDTCTALFNTAEGPFVIENVQQFYASAADKNSGLLSAFGTLHAKLQTTTAAAQGSFVPGVSQIDFDVTISHAKIDETGEHRFSESATLSATPRQSTLDSGYAKILVTPIVGKNGPNGHLPLTLTITPNVILHAQLQQGDTRKPTAAWPAATANLTPDGKWSAIMPDVIASPIDLEGSVTSPERLTVHDYVATVNFGTGIGAPVSSSSPYATCTGDSAGSAVNITFGIAIVDPTPILKAANADATFGRSGFTANDRGTCGHAAVSGGPISSQHSNGSVTLTDYAIDAVGTDLVSRGNAEVKVNGLGIDVSGPVVGNVLNNNLLYIKQFSDSKSGASLGLHLANLQVQTIGNDLALVGDSSYRLYDQHPTDTLPKLDTKFGDSGVAAIDLDVAKITKLSGDYDSDSGQPEWTIGVRYTDAGIVELAQGGGEPIAPDEYIAPVQTKQKYSVSITDGSLTRSTESDPVTLSFPKGAPMFTAHADSIALDPGSDVCVSATASLFDGAQVAASLFYHDEAKNGAAFFVSGSFATGASGVDLVPGLLELDGGAFGLAKNIAGPDTLFTKGATFQCNASKTGMDGIAVYYGSAATVNGQVGLRSLSGSPITYAIDASLTVTDKPSATLDAGAWILQSHNFAAGDENSAPLVGMLALDSTGVNATIGTKADGIDLLPTPRVNVSGQVGLHFGSGNAAISGQDLSVTAPVVGSVGGWFFVDTAKGIGAGGSYEIGPYGIDLDIAKADVSATIGLSMQLLTTPASFRAEAGVDFQAEVCFIACFTVDVGGDIVFQAPTSPTLAVTIHTPVGDVEFDA